MCVNVNANLPRASEAITEAIDLYKRLVEQLPQMFARQLLSAYWTLVGVLDRLGRVEEAADLRRQLDDAVGEGQHET